jgi:hypothetical protein
VKRSIRACKALDATNGRLGGQTGSSLLALIFAALTFLPSCSDEVVTVEIDPAFTVAAQNEVRRAGNEWNKRARSTLSFVDDGEWLILPAETPSAGLGYAQGRRKLIRISTRTPDDQVYAVALHELGHALGLKHTSKGVMDPTRQTMQFSDEDMQECSRVGACETP